MNSPAIKTTTMTNNSLASQLQQIGLCAVPTQLDDFLARVTKARCSAHQILEEVAKAEATERSRRSLERRLWRLCERVSARLKARELAGATITRSSRLASATGSTPSPT